MMSVKMGGDLVKHRCWCIIEYKCSTLACGLGAMH
jgi:hypothetical protein